LLLIERILEVIIKNKTSSVIVFLFLIIFFIFLMFWFLMINRFNLYSILQPCCCFFLFFFSNIFKIYISDTVKCDLAAPAGAGLNSIG